MSTPETRYISPISPAPLEEVVRTADLIPGTRVTVVRPGYEDRHGVIRDVTTRANGRVYVGVACDDRISRAADHLPANRRQNLYGVTVAARYVYPLEKS